MIVSAEDCAVAFIDVLASRHSFIELTGTMMTPRALRC